MSEGRGLLLLVFIVVLAAWAASVPPSAIQISPALQFAEQTNRVEPQQQAENAPGGQTSAQNKAPTNPGNVAQGSQEGGGQPGIESYTIDGIRFRITDGLLALFTFFLVVVGFGQGFLVMRQIKLGRQEFIATHRPRIILRDVVMGTVLEGQPIHVIMRFVNIGDSPAKILHSMADFALVSTRSPRFMIHVSVEPHNEIGALRFDAGQERLIPYGSLRQRPNSGRAPEWDAKKFMPRSRPFEDHAAASYAPTVWPPVRRPDVEINLIGQIIYVDKLGTKRRTAFRRVLDPELRLFRSIKDDTELDYAD